MVEIVLGIIVLVALLLLSASVRLVQQYQRGVVLRFGGCCPACANPACSSSSPSSTG